MKTTSCGAQRELRRHRHGVRGAAVRSIVKRSRAEIDT